MANSVVPTSPDSHDTAHSQIVPLSLTLPRRVHIFFYCLKGISVRLTVSIAILSLLASPAMSQSLIDAVKAHDIAAVRTLLALPVDINQKSPGGMTPLLFAVSSGDTSICYELLKHGADPNARSDSSVTPLMEAALHGFYTIVEALLKRGADVNMCAKMFEGPDGNPLANPRFMFRDASTRIVAVEKSALLLAVDGGHFAVARLLLDHGAEVNKQAVWFVQTPEAQYVTSGRTALMSAARQRFPALVRLLLERKADVNVQERATGLPGPSPRPEIAGVIDVTERPLFVKHSTALHIAAELNDRATAVLLLDAGANMEIRDGLNSTPLIAAIGNGCTSVAELLIKRGANVSAEENTPRSPLILAARRGKYLLVEPLIKAGASITQKAGESGDPLLSWAVVGGNRLVVRSLLEHGADVNAANNSNATPLMVAASEGEADIVRLLVAWKARVNLKDDEGRTALIVASKRGHGACVKALLQSGADATIRDNSGKTALVHAMEEGDQKVVRLLRDGGTATVASHSIENDRLSDLMEYFSTQIDRHDYSMFQYLAFSKPYGKWDVRPLSLASMPDPEGVDSIPPADVPNFVWGVIAHHDYELPAKTVQSAGSEFVKEGFVHKQRYCKNFYPSRRAAFIGLRQEAEQSSRSIYVQQTELANGDGYERVDNIYRQNGIYWHYVVPHDSPFQLSPEIDTLKGYRFSSRDESILKGLSQAGCYCLVKTRGYLVFMTGGLLDKSIGFIWGRPRPGRGSLGPLFHLALLEDLGDSFFFYVSE